MPETQVDKRPYSNRPETVGESKPQPGQDTQDTGLEQLTQSILLLTHTISDVAEQLSNFIASPAKRNVTQGQGTAPQGMTEISEPKAEDSPSLKGPETVQKPEPQPRDDTQDAGLEQLTQIVLLLTQKVDQLSKPSPAPVQKNVTQDQGTVADGVKEITNSQARKYALDLGERVLSTFVQGFAGGFVITMPLNGSMWYAALGGGVSAVLSLGKGLLARTRGSGSSASLSKNV